jgi:hypothetical protein
MNAMASERAQPLEESMAFRFESWNVDLVERQIVDAAVRG